MWVDSDNLIIKYTWEDNNMPKQYKAKKDSKTRIKMIDTSNVFMEKVISGTYNFLASPWSK